MKMNLKQVDWKYIVYSAIAIVIAMWLFMLYDNSFSLKVLIFVALIFPVIGILLSFSKRKHSITNGCLSGKTEEEKYDYFSSLFAFLNTDLIFYNDQLHDLLEDELEQYNKWLFDNKYSILHKKQVIIQSFEVLKPTNNIEQKGEILELSMFGEYCPDNSLRGYDLKDLLSKPNNYKPIRFSVGEVLEFMTIEKKINSKKTD